MKNGKIIFKNSFIAAVFFFTFAGITGCKNPAENSRLQTEEITVTVGKDGHVKKAPQNFKIAKNAVLGFTDLKEKLKAGLEFEENYELAKICLGNASGEEITDSNKYKFDKDTAVFIVSKIKGTAEEVKLLELKVDNISKTIENTMDFGKTQKDKVLIKAKAAPADAVIDFTPKLDNGFWKIEKGKKLLTITVKKGNNRKIYNAYLERVESDIPILKKITIGAESREGANITQVMTFTVPENASEVNVAAEAEPANAKIDFVPSLNNGKLPLSGAETSLKITVGENSKKSEYTVIIKKTASIKTLISNLVIAGGTVKGQASIVPEAQTDKILSGEKNVTVEVSGPYAVIQAKSKNRIWKSFKINGESFTFAPSFDGFKSESSAKIKLLQKGEAADIKIEAADENYQTEVNFKIKRLEHTVDVPVNILLINEKFAIRTPADLKALADGSKPVHEYEGTDNPNVEIQCYENALKSVVIDGTNCSVNQKKDMLNNDVWYAEHAVNGISGEGKEITVTMEPIDTAAYHSLTWNFKLKPKNPDPIRVSYEINGKPDYQLDKSFTDSVKKGENPLIEVKSKFLNLKLEWVGKAEKIQINEATIDGNTLTGNNNLYQCLHSVQLDTNEKQISITVTPEDKLKHSAKTFKFKAKSDGSTEVISPVFKEISGDKNLPKTEFLDKLTSGNPLYKTSTENADLVIELSGYQYDFLCKEVKINDEKVEMKKNNSFTVSYTIKKSIPVTAVPKNVRIEFIAKDGKASNLVWQFQVQSGGKKPGLPKNKITHFLINGAGDEFGDPLPYEFTEHLADGSNPLYEFEGNNAVVEVGCFNNTTIEKVIFKMDSEKKAELVPQKLEFAHAAKYEFEITDNEAHLIELIIYPKDKNYSELIYSFKLKKK